MVYGVPISDLCGSVEIYSLFCNFYWEIKTLDFDLIEERKTNLRLIVRTCDRLNPDDFPNSFGDFPGPKPCE